ncbi:hypothetical protein CR513_21788, partial [Mucuna pruriens]
MTSKLRPRSRIDQKSIRPKVTDPRGAFPERGLPLPKASSKGFTESLGGFKSHTEPIIHMKCPKMQSASKDVKCVKGRNARPKRLRASIRHYASKEFYETLLFITSYINVYTEVSILYKNNTNKVDPALDVPYPLGDVGQIQDEATVIYVDNKSVTNG